MDDIFIRRDGLMLKLTPLALLAVYVVKGVARYLQSYLMAAVGERVVARLRRELYTHIQSMPLSFFSDVHSADLMSRILTDVTRLARLSSGVLVMGVRQLGTIAALLVVMLAREWALTLTALVAFPAIALIVRTIGRRLYTINKRTQERVAQLAVLLHESFSGTKIVKAFGRERHEQARFDAINDRPGATRLETFTRALAFERVDFRYGDADEMTLKEISLEIRKGEVVAFVGMSGAGKSTLMDLVPRFHDVTAGRITLDGRDLRDVTQASLRAQLGVVTQETFLFSDTIRYNIAYGRPDATFEEIVRAARQAHAHDFTLACPDGYDTLVGERGVRLSGGQRQRIAIARAFLKNPPILILDEATSDLDAESEFMVQQALAELMRGRTVLAIAHRLATVRNADRIVVVHDGRIAEIGRHEELIALDGIYRRLYALQMEGVTG